MGENCGAARGRGENFQLCKIHLSLQNCKPRGCLERTSNSVIYFMKVIVKETEGIERELK